MSAAPSTSTGTVRRPTIHPCNFRYAGRLSNDNARALTTLHEKFALQTANSLEVYLGTSMQIRFVSLEQTISGDYASRVPVENYILPCALGVLESSFLIDMDASVVFPIIDVLLGGVGSGSEQVRELTEIDEDIMVPIGELMVKELERSWKALGLSLRPGRCIKPVGVSQVLPIAEKVVTLLFEMTVAGATGNLKIVLPTSFVGYLLRHLKAAQSKKISALRHLPNPTLRERLLDGSFMVATDQTQIRVLVRDLVGLRPGSILHMQAPVKNTGRLTVEDIDIFEATVVRSGRRKAAQLMARSLEPMPDRE
ncbi:flagellar motor switch protein FliM [Bryocella elongata]|uniref:Flagellar motor switch protein FliM n=1 Tax=Bryocella elongata TaxID=863522 RepID=A0A1H5TLU5_9BACT|nr:flagellar motor switch protein FliM [Bryocella elongata]SEF62997.1 flagellar motor switch protein FliM [Bryocella elongata]